MISTSQAALGADPNQAAAILGYCGHILVDHFHRFDYRLKPAFAQFKEAGSPSGSCTGPHMVICINHYTPDVYLKGAACRKSCGPNVGKAQQVFVAPMINPLAIITNP